jgi:hypothetical protein
MNPHPFAVWEGDELWNAAIWCKACNCTKDELAYMHPNVRHVTDLKPGDRVDLESCPFLHSHPSAFFEYAVVGGVERETEDCVRIDYEGIDSIGYPVGTFLVVAVGQ